MTSEPLLLNGCIDQPSSEVTEGVVEISGWCFHRLDQISHLQVLVNGTAHDARFALFRPDVAMAFPDVRGAERSGFLATISLKPGSYRVGLRAHVDRHGIFETGRLRDFRVVPRMPAGGFVPFLLRKARSRLVEGRGFPGWRELVQLIHYARADHNSETFRTRYSLGPKVEPYEAWLSLNVWTAVAAEDLKGRLATRSQLPLISIITPVFRPDLSLFDETIRSVREQVHEGWEWCLADDASDDAALTERLTGAASEDPRIRFTTRPVNGHISAASNSAAQLATGEFLAFLDHDDLLSPDCIGEVALYLADHPDVDVLYTDDDKIDLNGRRHSPQFKPEWSPESLLSQMYLCHLLVVRRSLFEEVGGFRQGFEGSQDHDLALRVTERARRIGHLPHVLYHWREAEHSTSVSGNAKPYSFAAALKATDEALTRRGSSGTAYRPTWAIDAGASLIAHTFPDDGPRVAVLIATRNGLQLLERCLQSLAVTTYRNYEVVILDDGSDEPETQAFLADYKGQVLRSPQPRTGFNYAALHNHAARQVSAEYLVFLNNDTEVRSESWLSQLVGFGRLPGVGVVGARLLFPNLTIQHAGVLSGFNQGNLAYAFRGLPAEDAGYLAAAKVCRNYGAVTAACMLTPRDLFLSIGGFDEDTFPVSFNDIDYCYRLVDAGYRCVYAAGAELIHHEGASRGSGSTTREVALFKERYRFRKERYYSPHLSTTSERFEVRPRRLARRAPRPVRAALFTHALDLTGAPLYLLELTKGLLKKGILEPTVLAPSDGPIRERFADAGVPVTIVPPAELMDAVTLGRRIGSMDVELVFANTLRMFPAVDAARRAGVPSVWTIHESEPYSELPEPVQQAALRCFSVPYRVVFVSYACRALFEPLNSAHNFEVLHVGLPCDRLPAPTPAARAQARRTLAIEAGDVVIVVVGTVCERKGQQDLVKALRQMPATAVSKIQCFIVGDRPGPYSDELKRLVSVLPEPVRSRVRVVPETADIVKYLHAADIFVCTSRVESYPRVTLEAMSAGLPIVSTPVFGLREQLCEGLNALFYQPGDTQALARELDRLTESADLRIKLGLASSGVLAGLLSFDEMIDVYDHIFREAAESSVTV